MLDSSVTFSVLASRDPFGEASLDTSQLSLVAHHGAQCPSDSRRKIAKSLEPFCHIVDHDGRTKVGFSGGSDFDPNVGSCASLARRAFMRAISSATVALVD